MGNGAILTQNIVKCATYNHLLLLKRRNKHLFSHCTPEVSCIVQGQGFVCRVPRVPYFVMIKGEKMRKLEKEELGGLDSTSKTIKKWDNFFKTALPNLGYQQSLIDKMYPYDAGIPMLDGSKMPVNETTGRVFFQMSAADKLCCLLSTLYIDGSTTRSNANYIQKVLVEAWKTDQEFFKACFPEEEYNVPKDETLGEAYWLEHFRSFILDSDVSISKNGQDTQSTFLERELTDSEKRAYFNIPQPTFSEEEVLFPPANFSFYRIFNKTLATNYDYKFNRVRWERIWINETTSTAMSRFQAFSEVYLQDYLVISLNPIDKFMCSTKQAFGSCMSIAKQCDVYGTSSPYAFGLPALFPTDSVYLVFMTAGKHKNMYWESAEWEKDPANRDPEKAYKYLKMTCRALTYKGSLTLDKSTESDDELTKLFSQDRLYIGRQYSARGEDFAWQSIISYLLGKAGVSTSFAYANTRSKYLSSGIQKIAKALNQGVMPKEKAPVAIDRYGFARGVYYDNIFINFCDTCGREPKTKFLGSDGYKYPIDPATKISTLQNDDVRIHIGSSRSGSCGRIPTWTNSGLDMFKLMLGIQNYSYFNRYVIVCDECGEITSTVVSVEYSSEDTNRTEARLCPKCLEKSGFVKCPICGTWYKGDDEGLVKRHRCFNLWEKIDPENISKHKPKDVCMGLIYKANSYYNKVLCVHCGTFERDYNISDSEQTTITDSETGITFKVGLCSTCMHSAVVCSKCKKILFLDETKDACLLLPKKRIICPDCIKSIRLKQKEREMLQHVVDNIGDADLEETKVPKNSLSFEQTVLQKRKGIRMSARIRDVQRQIRSYQASHPDQTILSQL